MSHENDFKYFYGNEADTYTFYRIKKWVLIRIDVGMKLTPIHFTESPSN